MTDVPVSGRCFCGGVRYRATATAKEVGVCYCTDCTRAVGSLVTVWAGFDSDRFEFVEGEPTRFESSPGVIRTFCGRCGTSLTSHYRDRRQVDVATATLDDPRAFPPTTEGPHGARPAWMCGLASKRTDRDER